MPQTFAIGRGLAGKPRPRVQPQAPAADPSLTVDHERALAKLETLKLKLAIARGDAAEAKAQLGTALADNAELDRRLASISQDCERLLAEKKYLHRQLQFCWASYPGSADAWRDRPEGSDPMRERADALRARLVAALAEPGPATPDRRVTAVVTSCDRHDLLSRTIRSFFAANTWPVERMIVVEDGAADAPAEVREPLADLPITWINTGARVGQVRAIDAAYALVGTPYIFHLEDDWQFARPGFIERSMTILEAEPLCLQVALRGDPGPEAADMLGALHASGDTPWRRVARHRTVWNGFTFNPGLKRLRDYRLLGSYADHVEASLGHGGMAEAQLSELYGSIGFFAASLWTNGGEQYIRHMGRGRHVV